MSKDKDLELGLIPPYSIELEQAVLGAIMLEKGCLETVIDLLKPTTFYKESHKSIYNAILSLYNSSEPIDIRTVVHKLREMKELDLVGGSSYVAGLTRFVASGANTEYHTRILKELELRRTLIETNQSMIAKSYNLENDVFELLDENEQKIYEAGNFAIKKEASSINKLCDAYLKNLFSRQQSTGGVTGIPSGFYDLDKITHGWQKTDLIIVAARPAMGKTAFALSILRNASVDFSKPVAIFSLEMSNEQMTGRLIASETLTHNSKLQSEVFDEFEQIQLTEKLQKLKNSKIFIDDTASLSILELRSKARRLKSKHGIELIIVDYLQLMSGNSKGNREQEISSISRALKQMAKELDVPVIALSQLSRAVETRGGDKKPQLSDLRESGSIEQDSDMVIFLHRPEYYGITEDAEGKPTKGICNIIIAKHRNGALGEPKVGFKGEYTKMVSLNDIDNVPSPIPQQGNSEHFYNSYFSIDSSLQINQFESETDLPF